MTLVERNKIDNIIKEYLLLDIRIKILKAKIKHYAYSSMYNHHKPIIIITTGIDIKTILEANTRVFSCI